MQGLLDATTITRVWLALGGLEPKRGRAPAFYRDGDNPEAVSLNEVKGCWFDHRDGVGGGVLDLIQRVLGCNRAGALRWLEGEGLIEPRTLTREQRRRHARRRGKASSAALEIARWRCAFAVELNARKLAAMESGDDEALERAASLCNVVENGLPADIIREFIHQGAGDAADVARFVALGEERDHEARRIVAEVVLLLARAAESEDLRRAS